MHKKIVISEATSDPTINICLDTIQHGKQALVFVNTKRGAESQAEKIAKKTALKDPVYSQLAEEALKTFSRPTKQCQRLALCLKGGTAFHHAGLPMKQRELVEEGFRKGTIKVICCTPTLCVSKDTLIWHETFETEISKLTNFNPIFVLSKNNLILMKSQKIQKIKNLSKLIEISSVSGYSIKVTPNHKMLIKRGGRKGVVPAKIIQKTDRIATVGRLNLSKLTIPSLKNFIVDNILGCQNYKFNPILSYLIGAMLGDGYSGAETGPEGIFYKGSPCIVGADEEVLSSVENACKLLNLCCRRSKNHYSVPQLVLAKNKWFREFLVRCGIEKGDKKYIADKLMSMDFENTAFLLKGLFDTDGYLDKRIGPGFSNTSDKLIRQVQKLLLRFGVVSTIRKRKGSSMILYEKEYLTKHHFELLITQKRSTLNFYRYLGFNIERKQQALIDLISKICSNFSYVSCNPCAYKIYKDLFSGRSTEQKKWGLIKLRIIRLLGEKGELASNDLKMLLNYEHKKKEKRLNHHYELIKKRRIGSRSKTERFWSLNNIGRWVYNNLITKKKGVREFLKLRICPLCNSELDVVLKKGWRDSDFEGDIFWDKISHIEKVDEENEVYDVVLPDRPKNDHMFVANGFIVHNSYGMNLPAFRTIIRDLQRYGGRGMEPIPVLEYQQMIGRSGRPDFHDDYGEAIALASSESHEQEIYETYVTGEPEAILSKLAAEPALRTYTLALIAAHNIRDKKDLYAFFQKTLFAHQYQDLEKLNQILNRVLKQLQEWKFIEMKASDFQSADEYENEPLRATLIGRRVAELYLDPYTAHFILESMDKATSKETMDVSYVHMLTRCLELRPLLTVKISEIQNIREAYLPLSEYFLEDTPTEFDDEYEDYLKSVKTTLFLKDWLEEKDEEYLLEQYGVRPGELFAKLEVCDWLLYSSGELAKLQSYTALFTPLSKLRVRLKYGAKEELLALLQLKDIGRVRARKLHQNGIKSLGDVRAVDVMKLSQLLGPAVAKNVKEQVGQKVEEVPKGTRKGQLSLEKYNKEKKIKK